MKKIALSILALAALSTASLANERRSYELRDIQPFMGGSAAVTVESAPLAVDYGILTAFDRVKLTQERDEGTPR